MTHPLTETMTARNLRLTKPRKAVFDVLNGSSRPLSIAEIVRLCPSVDRASVYRTIHTLTYMGIIRAVPHGWRHTYELADPYKPHHHHLTCERCNQLVEIRSRDIEHIVSATEQKYGFTSTSHHFEIRGTCSACAVASSR